MRIFICYRRGDSAGYTGRLYDLLANHFGSDKVFMDIDTIRPGEDFSQAVEKSVGSCDVVLTIIGKNWLTITDDQGNRRLNNPHDWVRIEISTALKHGKHIIPVLVQDAEMPGVDDLPDDMKNLSLKQAVEISDTRFKYDAGRLTDVLENIVGKPQISKSRFLSSKVLVTITSAIIIVGLIIIAYFAFQNNTSPIDLAVSTTLTAESNRNVQTAVVATITPHSSPTDVPLSPTSTSSSTYYFEDGCIDKTIWSLLQNDLAPEENNCWKLDSKGIFAKEGTGLFINVIGPQRSIVNGLVTEILANTDVSFDMQISELSTISEWNTYVAVGLLPSTNSIPSQNGTSILFQSGQPNKPIWMMLEIPNADQIFLPPPRISPNTVYNVKLEIRDKRLITYLDYEKVDDRDLSESNPYLWVGYAVAEGGKLSVTLSDFSINK